MSNHFAFETNKKGFFSLMGQILLDTDVYSIEKNGTHIRREYFSRSKISGVRLLPLCVKGFEIGLGIASFKVHFDVFNFAHFECYHDSKLRT